MTVELKEINFRYRERLILKSVNAEFISNGLNFILGENGSGKSTLLKCICGLLTPEHGQVLIKGMDIRGYSLKEKSRLISYTPQYINFEKAIIAFDL